MKPQRKTLRYLALILVFIGPPFLVVEHVEPARRFLFADLENGRKILSQMKENDRDGKSIGIIGKKSPGFKRIVSIVKKNNPHLRDSTISYIAETFAPLSFGDGVKFEITEVSFESNPLILRPIAWKTDLDRWIMQYQRRWILSIGLPMFFVGYWLQYFVERKDRRDITNTLRRLVEVRRIAPRKRPIPS